MTHPTAGDGAGGSVAFGSDDELVDVYDEHGSHLGVRRRADAHRDGDWHDALHCWVVAARPDGPVVLLQRRGPRTPWFPGHLDVTAAGHLAAGETPGDALREVAEEIGVTVALTDLRPVGRLVLSIDTPTMRNRERAHVYLSRS